MEGFQLWLNLPAKDKMRTPWYRDIPAAEIPTFTTAEGVDVKVIAGASHGIDGAMQRDHTAPLYLDLALPAGARFAQSLPASRNAFVHVYRGEARIAGTAVPMQRMAVLANTAGSDGVVIEATQAGARVLLIAGEPLGESIAQHGPFVMNTKEEIMAAVHDYQAGRFGGIA